MFYVDTNVFLRFIVQDNPAHAQEALEFVEALTTRTIEATICEGVIVEMVQVLTSPRLYDMPRSMVRDRMLPILNLPGLRLEHAQVYRDALIRFANSNLDFVDCLIAEHAIRQRGAAIVSFDRDFDRIPSLQRVSPRGSLAT